MAFKWAISNSGNGLSSVRFQTITRTNAAGSLLTKHPAINFSEISIKIRPFSFKKMYLQTSSAKWRPFLADFNVWKPHSQCPQGWQDITGSGQGPSPGADFRVLRRLPPPAGTTSWMINTTSRQRYHTSGWYHSTTHNVSGQTIIKNLYCKCLNTFILWLISRETPSICTDEDVLPVLSVSETVY